MQFRLHADLARRHLPTPRPESRLGFHSASISLEQRFARNKQGNKAIAAYMAEMGVPQYVIDLQPIAGPCCILYIDHAQATALGLLSEHPAKQQTAETSQYLRGPAEAVASQSLSAPIRRAGRAPASWAAPTSDRAPAVVPKGGRVRRDWVKRKAYCRDTAALTLFAKTTGSVRAKRPRGWPRWPSGSNIVRIKEFDKHLWAHNVQRACRTIWRSSMTPLTANEPSGLVEFTRPFRAKHTRHGNNVIELVAFSEARPKKDATDMNIIGNI